MARVELHKLGVELPEHPTEALLKALAVANGEFEVWKEEVTKVPLDELAASPYLKLMHESQDRIVAYSVGALRANVEQKRIEFSKRQGETLAKCLRSIVAALGHDPNDFDVRTILRAGMLGELSDESPPPHPRPH